MRRFISFFAIFLLSISTFVLADKPFDPVTARDTRAYPPDPQVNFSNIALDINMPDPLSKSFTCDETITFAAPAARAVDRLDLNAVELQIDSVKNLNDQPVNFRYDGKMLTVRFDPPLAAGAESGLKIHYTCSNPKQGMNFALPDDKYPKRPVSIHTQGETETNRYWFVSHDYPNAKQTSEITVTIPSKYKALSNGALVSQDNVGNGMTKWHYKIGHPHPAYLVSLVIGEFSVVKDEWRGKPVEYWVPPSQEKNAKRSFGRTPEMIELFSTLTHFDYPWEKYAQAVVYNFGAGGMENTSCTTLIEIASLDERGAIDNDLEGLVSHELGHQWFGDTITCKSWPHTWLNEGWATFMDAVWHEHAHGRESYDHQIWSSMQGVAATDDPTAKGGVVWFGDGDDGGEIFGRSISNPYGKGSVVIHMLRTSLGDELFWNIVGTYLHRNAFKPVETDDLRKVCDELSGKSYERFFQQWIYRAGTPKISVKYSWDDSSKQATITFEQTQTITENAPAFSADVPIYFDDQKNLLSMDGRTGTLIVKLDHEPKRIVVDPFGSLLAKWELDLPQSMLVEQAKAGPTPMSRFNAIAALASHDRADARETLKSIMLDDAQNYFYRTEAADALGKMHADEARDILLSALAENNFIKEPHVRRAAIGALLKYKSPKVAVTELRFAKHDESGSVEATASDVLGEQEPTDEIINQLIANTKKPSFRDEIRSQAVSSLGEISDERGLKPAMELASYGETWRIRPPAIAAVGKIGSVMKDKTEARKFLIGLLDDSQDRPASVAIRALGELGDEKAIDALEMIVNSSAPESKRHAAQQAIDTINKHESNESGALRALRDRVEILEKAREEKKESPTTAPSK